MLRRPPKSTRTDPLLPYTTLLRSLHMGVLGPRRVVVNDGGFAPPPPAQIVDNEYSILDATDLVMIDPVGTGFSKPVGKAEGRSEEHTSELQSLMRTSYAVFCLKQKNKTDRQIHDTHFENTQE